MEGARLLYVEDDKGRQVLPYIDGEMGYANEKLTRVCDYACERIDGLADAPESEDDGSACCPHCEETFDESDGCGVWTGIRTTQFWCPHCFETSTFYCDGLDRTFSDNVSCYEMGTGETWSVFYYESHGGRCDATNTYWPEDDLVAVVVNDAGRKRTWSLEHAKENAREIDGSWYANELDDDAIARIPYRETSPDQTELTLSAAE
jgi:hypothetical protein